MQKTSTHLTREQRGGEQKMVTMKPKKATVDFIKQFALEVITVLLLSIFPFIFLL